MPLILLSLGPRVGVFIKCVEPQSREYNAMIKGIKKGVQDRTSEIMSYVYTISSFFFLISLRITSFAFLRWKFHLFCWFLQDNWTGYYNARNYCAISCVFSCNIGIYASAIENDQELPCNRANLSLHIGTFIRVEANDLNFVYTPCRN